MTIPKQVLEQLSDDDLLKISKSKNPSDVLPSLSDDALSKIASYKPPSLASDVYEKTTEGLLFGAKPFVAGVGGGIGQAAAEITRQDKGLLERIKSLGSEFGKGFSASRQEALKQEKEISERSPTASTITGIGTALATAPLFAVKGAQAAAMAPSVVGKLTQGSISAAKLGGAMGATQALGHAESLGEAVGDVALGAGTGLGVQVGLNALSAAAPKVISGAGKALKKVASNLTGISETEIKTYSQRANEVKELIRKSGGDIPEAADQVRNQITKEIQVSRQKLNNQIADALTDPKYQGVLIDASPVLKSLEDSLSKVSRVSAEYRPGEINNLKNIIDTTKKFAGQDGTISLQDLQSVKGELQKLAQSSYDKGQVIFPVGEMAARAAKGAAAEAKRLVDKAAPEIAKANSQLSRLHAIEDVMNKNLIKAGKPESALIAAGSGSNPRNARLLSGIDKITGGTAQKQAENLAAARSFGNTQLLPVDTTGKAVARMMAAGATGAAIGNPALAVAGMAASSPASLKLALDVSRMTKAVGGAMASNVQNVPLRTGLITGLSQNRVENKRNNGAIGRRLEQMKR